MGLAEPRKRLKLSHDPNNLAWSQNNNSFGQKILAQQGWTPGSFLGAKDAKHRPHYTDASASHIRIKVKDDNLGLGAQTAGKIAEQSRHTDLFQGLLGRLNGKSEVEIEKEQKKGDEMRLALYANGKWGGMNFVRGGVLVQGKDFIEGIEELKKTDPSKSKEEKVETQPEDEDSDAAEKRRKEEKRKRKEARRERKSRATSENESTPLDNNTEDQVSDYEAKKERKRKRKEEKRLAKLQGQKPPADVSSSDEESQKKNSKKSKSKSSTTDPETTTTEASTPKSGTSTPVPIVKSGVSTPPVRTGRHLLRGRNYQAKRMAFQDANGLDGIFSRVSTPTTSS